MRLSSFLAVVLGVLLSLSTGCTDAVQPEPAPVAPPVEEPPAPPSAESRGFPALTRPGEIYNGADSIYSHSEYHGGTLLSRYVLYQDGTFALQFLSPRFGFFEYPGRFSRAGSLITFGFDATSTAGEWRAVGTLSGDFLAVEYNILMLLSDFADGVYVRSPEAQ